MHGLASRPKNVSHKKVLFITNQPFSYMVIQYTLFCLSMRYTSAIIIMGFCYYTWKEMMNYYGAMLDWYRKCRDKLVFVRETTSAWSSASIKGPIPGNRTALLVATMSTERILEHISEDLQTLKWSNNNNNNNKELRTQNLKPTFPLPIFLRSHNNNNNNNNNKTPIQQCYRRLDAWRQKYRKKQEKWRTA